MGKIYQLGDFTVQYELEGTPSWCILPTAMVDNVTAKEIVAEPLVQFKLMGDNYPTGFSQGLSMKGAQAVWDVVCTGQESSQSDECMTICTYMQDGRGNHLRHIAVLDGITIRVHTEFENATQTVQTLEMLSSFTLGGLTPFQPGDAAGALVLHRMQSFWSAEGRLESRPVEDYLLEPSWGGYNSNARSLRFGQVGSMPVRTYFPFVAVEDTQAGVLWGAQLAIASSWQMEVTRRDNGLSFSGGLADREFGHWMKQLQPGEVLRTPEAVLSVCCGDIDDLCARLVSAQETAATPDSERLPVIYNEYCTTWGKPTLESIQKIAARLEGSGVQYLVIDAGWYCQDGKHWGNSMGDWQPSQSLFPNGIQEAADAVRAHGMVPGIWFELETVGSGAEAFALTDHLLKRDGVPLTVGSRRFWDMQDPWVWQYLTERVIAFIKQCGFGYLKIDYNETIGIGCDGAESQGEALRQKVLATQAFFQAIRDAVPGIVIENCASGGHRLEPSMMALADMASFSDAHECIQIPVIAANVQRAIPAWKSQIWAVLRKTDSLQRLYYSISAALLGWMCLSGEIFDLSAAQWAAVHDGIAFYQQAKNVIRHGISKRFGPVLPSYNHPAGWQAVVRQWGRQALVVFHAFAQPPRTVTLPVSGTIIAFYGGQEPTVRSVGGQLVFDIAKEFSGCALLLDLVG